MIATNRWAVMITATLLLAPSALRATTSESTATDDSPAARRAHKHAIEAAGARTSARARAKEDARLQKSIDRVNEETSAKGPAVVASLLGTEFGVSAREILEEQQFLSASLGDLMVAHTLMAGFDGKVTVDLLEEMRDETHSWAQVAAGMGYALEDVTGAIHTRADLATGLTPADGSVPLSPARPIPNAAESISGSAGAVQGAEPVVDLKTGIRIGR